MKYILAVLIICFSGAVKAEEDCSMVTPGLDHILWAVPNLQEGAKIFEGLTGVKPILGGIHTNGGTGNYLVSLGYCVYFEIYGPAPNGVLDEGSQFLEDMDKPSLFSYAVHSSNLEEMAQSGLEAGLKAGSPKTNGRARPDGVMLNWEAFTFLDHPFADFMPFVIDWKNSPHPSGSTPEGATIKAFEVTHPEGEKLKRYFKAMGLPISVKIGPHDLKLILNTPKGEVELDYNLGN